MLLVDVGDLEKVVRRLYTAAAVVDRGAGSLILQRTDAGVVCIEY